MTWDEVVTLINNSNFIKDELNQRKSVQTKNKVFCNSLPVGRNDFYSAGQTGIKLQCILVVHSYEYNNEQEVEFEGRKLIVYRTYKKSIEETELHCIEKVGKK